jgi:hypothetical protein
LAIAGTPFKVEKANVATANPIIRCMIAPFMVPAYRAG